MADQYEVLTEALREHAKKVDRISNSLAGAVDAAREMSLPTDAYGSYCQTLPMMLNPLQHLAATALDGSAKRLTSTATASGQLPCSMRTSTTPTRWSCTGRGV
ncbi:MAG TPA: type VII secretion target [Pseudonocardiaceae bacterium]|nr:type VII secretion target [Pseudonocardiaceae bacterium]